MARHSNSTYVGPVFVNITIRMKDYEAMFTILADFDLGPHAIEFLSASRVTAHPIPTAATPSTWGRLKSLYR